MLKKSLILKSLQITVGISISTWSLLYLSRYYFEAMWTERLWILLGGDFLEGGYIQSVIYFCGVLNLLLIRERQKVILYQDKSYKSLDKVLRPANKKIIFITSDLQDLKNSIEESKKLSSYYISKIIVRVCAKFRTTQSISESMDILNGQFESRAELDYADTSIIRYLNWCVPSFGFIGTIFGISGALNIAGGGDINAITSILGVAFDTTLVSLVVNIFLTLKCNQLESRSDKQLVEMKDYITDHLINNIEVRSYEEKVSA